MKYIALIAASLFATNAFAADASVPVSNTNIYQKVADGAEAPKPAPAPTPAPKKAPVKKAAAKPAAKKTTAKKSHKKAPAKKADAATTSDAK